MTSSESSAVQIRPATTQDVVRIVELMEPLVSKRILLGKDLVELYGAVPEFVVAVGATGEVVGYGALHVMWEHLGEVRTLGVAEGQLGLGVGRAILMALEEKARALGLQQLFCLTFETHFFGRNGFEAVEENAELVAADVYAELLRSTDEGVAEFLDLARVKPNTLGNTRMLKRLTR